MKRTGYCYVLLVLTGIILCGAGCHSPSVNAPEDDVVIRLNVRFGDAETSGSVFDGSDEVTVAKAGAIDRARVMVVDASAYESEDAFYQSDGMYEYDEMSYDESVNWADWNDRKNFVERHFDLVSDNELVVGPLYATGFVQGVEGLNWILLAFEENGAIVYEGETVVSGVRGEVNEADLEVWDYYQEVP